MAIDDIGAPVTAAYWQQQRGRKANFYRPQLQEVSEPVK